MNKDPISHFLVFLMADSTVGRGYTLSDALRAAWDQSSVHSRHVEVFEVLADQTHPLSCLSVGPRGSVSWPHGATMKSYILDLEEANA